MSSRGSGSVAGLRDDRGGSLLAVGEEIPAPQAKDLEVRSRTDLRSLHTDVFVERSW
jgi:hypothetical protein